MIDIGINTGGRGRPETNLVYQKKIFEFMVVNKLQGKPSAVLLLLKEWIETQAKHLSSLAHFHGYTLWARAMQADALPSYTTVHRLMKKFQKTPLMDQDLQELFHYPRGMKSVGWQYDRIPLECLRYYSENFGVRPLVGLVQWFCRMALARESDFSNTETAATEMQQIALYAEICWFSDLLQSLGKPTPDLTFLELQLVWKSWKVGDDDEKYMRDALSKGLNPDGSLLDASDSYWLLLTDMPTFIALLPKERNKLDDELELSGEGSLFPETIGREEEGKLFTGYKKRNFWIEPRWRQEEERGQKNWD